MVSRTIAATLPILLSVAAQSPSASAPTAVIDSGTLIGTRTLLPTASAAVNQFLGVPFAVSPPERFSPPAPPAKFTAPRLAPNFSAACIQQFLTAGTSALFNTPAPAESEDCLYLNVFAPDAPVAADNARAVMFWIYGGSLEFGNAGQPAYDGSHFAAYENVVVVTTNYRTNVFGFPESPDLPITGENLGFLDQRMALDWVQRNIAAFGGDPEKVLIFGESAGALSVDAILTSYNNDTKLPFRAAILESGTASILGNPSGPNYSSWNSLSAYLNCPGSFADNLTCVRNASAADIKNIIQTKALVFEPVVDNITLVAHPNEKRRSGNIARVPVLAGTNAQEGRVFELGLENLTSFLISTFGNNATLNAAITAAYAPGTPGLYTLTSPYDIISQIYTEYVFQCPQAIMANDSALTKIPTWRYYFNATFANTQAVPGLGAYHSSEIEIVYRTYVAANTTVQQYALSLYMQGAWARFARNPAGGPGWDAVDVGTPVDVLLGAEQMQLGGLYEGPEGMRTSGAYNLGVLGDVGMERASGVTVVPQSQLDYRCSLFAGLYAAAAGI